MSQWLSQEGRKILVERVGTIEQIRERVGPTMHDAAETSRDLLALCSLTDGGDRCDWGVIARQAHRERTLDALKGGTVIESSERAHRTGWLIATASPVQWAGAYDRADAELEAAAAHGARLTTVLDDDYPTNLRFIHNLPPFLFYRGALDPHLDARSIAVVGTRSASGEGLAAPAGWRAGWPTSGCRSSPGWPGGSTPPRTGRRSMPVAARSPCSARGSPGCTPQRTPTSSRRSSTPAGWSCRSSSRRPTLPRGRSPSGTRSRRGSRREPS